VARSPGSDIDAHMIGAQQEIPAPGACRPAGKLCGSDPA
jgi:hypothetical protein